MYYDNGVPTPTSGEMMTYLDQSCPVRVATEGDYYKLEIVTYNSAPVITISYNDK